MNKTEFGKAVKTESKGETTAKEVKAPYYRSRCLYYNKKTGACKMEVGNCPTVNPEGNCDL